MSQTSDTVFDAIAKVMAEPDTNPPGIATGGMLVWSWHDEDGDERISVATTDKLPAHLMIGMAGWIDEIGRKSLTQNTYDPDEEEPK